MEKQTLENAMENWLETRKEVSLKPSSYERLKVSHHQMQQYAISRKRLTDLTSDDIQSYLNRLRADGYALTTIKKQYSLLSGFLKYAYGRGDIRTPIYVNVSLPKESAVVKKRKQVEAYSMEEQRRLNSTLETLDSPLYAVAILMLEEGLRIGEVLALTWDDILWNRRAIRVSKTVVRLTTRSNYTFVQDSPKSRSSNRIIPLSTRAERVLRTLVEQATEDYIFQGCTYEAVRYHLQEACKKAGVPYKGTHIFRHTFATNCYNRGCDVKILSKLLGHSDVAITYNVYIHLYGDALDEMRAVIG